MLKMFRARLTYANVMATVAVFIALGGTSIAAINKITGKEVAKHTLTGNNLKSNSVGGRVINEKSLSPVPRARNSARLGGLPASQFLVHCPEGTIPSADVCVETQARPPAALTGAIHECAITDNQSGPGRRLPTYGELVTALEHQEIQLAAGGEFTSEVSASTSVPEHADVIYVTDKLGHVGLAPDSAAGAKSYRCVADPRN
jgi:hypothetical protein